MITKLVDSASDELYNAFSTAKNLPEVTFYHLIGNDQHCQYQVILHNVQIDRYTMHASAEGAIEEIEFSFAKHEIRTTPTDAADKATPAKSTGFNSSKIIQLRPN